jgi:hypothetical protein
MRLVIRRGEPIEEVAGQAATLARFRALLDVVAAEAVAAGTGVVDDGRGLLALPFVPDPGIPPLTVVLRPRSTPLEQT